MVTLLELRDNAKERADMEDSDFVTDPAWNVYINDAVAELYDLIISAYEDYFTLIPAPEFTIPNGSDTLTLPVDFYKLRGLDLKQGTSNYTTIEQYNFGERNNFKINNLARQLYDATVTYRLIGNVIQILPVEQAAATYRLWYVPISPTLTLDADILPVIKGWEDYVVIKAAMKALIKEESDVSVMILEIEKMEERIINMSADRDAGSSERITDVTSVFSEGNSRGSN